jgi:hypothetical protein
MWKQTELVKKYLERKCFVVSGTQVANYRTANVRFKVILSKYVYSDNFILILKDEVRSL